MNASTIHLEQHAKEVTSLTKEVTFLTEKIQSLEEQLAWFKRQVFGQKAEKFVAPQELQPYLTGFENLDSVDPKPNTKIIKAHERKERKPTGKDAFKFPENLPVECQIIDIPEEEKICEETGKPLIKIGEEITSKLAHKPGCYFIKQIIRPKYGLPQGSEGGVRTAELPDSLLTRCQADESLLAEILVRKFVDHLPLYRQSEIMFRDGVFISRQILCQWVLRTGEALKPLYDQMRAQILASGNIFYDETPIDMLSPGKGKVHQAYMWVLVGGKSSNPGYRIYDFQLNRRHHHAADMLKGYRGFLHSDKYGAYEVLAKQKLLIWAPCWAHIRRKFIEAETGDPPFRDWVLRKIKHLFWLERIAWARSEEERLRIRQEKEVPIIDELIQAIKARLISGTILPKSKFREALGYFISLIPYLKNYTLDPWARIDNNVAERAVRPLALGRKNWLFVGNENGGIATAVVLSLVQSCRALGVNPREYLEDVMRRLMSHSANKLHELLPDRWMAAKKLSASNLSTPDSLNP